MKKPLLLTLRLRQSLASASRGEVCQPPGLDRGPRARGQVEQEAQIVQD